MGFLLTPTCPACMLDLCSNVAVPVTLTYISDAGPLLITTASRAAESPPLPADFSVVSGALMLEASGLKSGPLPCDGCVARLTIPLSEAASAAYSYSCAHVVAGQAYLDAAVVTAGTARNTAADSGSVVDCSVTQAGTYVVGRVLRAVEAPAQGVSGADAAAEDAQQAVPGGVPAVVGGVVGGVVGAVLVATVALVVVQRRCAHFQPAVFLIQCSSHRHSACTMQVCSSQCLPASLVLLHVQASECCGPPPGPPSTRQ